MLSWSAEGIMLQSDCAKLAKADDSALLLLLGLSMEADSPAVSLAKAGGDPHALMGNISLQAVLRCRPRFLGSSGINFLHFGVCDSGHYH